MENTDQRRIRCANSMSASASVAATRNHAKDETVVIDFRLEHFKKYKVVGDFVYSPLQKAGNGFACLKVYPCGSHSGVAMCSHGYTRIFVKVVSVSVEFAPHVFLLVG